MTRQNSSWLSTASVIISALVVIVPVGRYILTPWFVTVATDALAAEIDEKCNMKVEPLKLAAKSGIQDKIDELKLAIDLLAAKRQRDPSKFTDADVTALNGLISRLARQEEALTKISR